MQPISIGKFLLGITIIGLLWLACKPMMDEMLDSVLPIAAMSDLEIAIFELLMWICASILLIWLVVKVTRRSGDQ